MLNFRFSSTLRSSCLSLMLVCGVSLFAQEKAAAIETPLPPETQSRLQALQETANSARSAVNIRVQAETLNEIGKLFFRTSNYAKATASYAEADKLARSIKDAADEAEALSGEGSCDLLQGATQKGLDRYRHALKVATTSGDLRGQAMALNGIGWAKSNLGRGHEAVDFQVRALALARRSQDKTLEADVLLRLGMANSALGQKADALDDYDQALALYRGLNDRFGEAAALNDIGILHDDMGEKQKAFDFYNQALAIRREIGDRDGIAWTLTNIGNASKATQGPQKALALYAQALVIFVEVGDRGAEAATRNNEGAVYRELGEQQKALDSYNLALSTYRDVGDRAGEAAILTNIGNVYYALGDKQAALSHYKLAVPIRREVGNPAGEANTLNNIGAVYVELGQNTNALSYLDRALLIRRGLGDRVGEATTLINLGNLDFTLGRKRKSLDDYTLALKLHRATSDTTGEAGTLNNIGFVYGALGEQQTALGYFNQALPLATAVHDPIEEARVDCNLMLNLASVQPTLAIYYGKQAVNLLQQVRGNIAGLDKALQKSFLASKEDCYHKLAELLIAQTRLPEAQQVLDSLKQQEYSDYVRGEEKDPAAPLALTPAEQEAEQEYQRSTGQLVALGDEWAALRRIGSRTPDQQKRYEDLSAQLNTASKGLNDYYARLYVLLGNDGGANRQVADVKGDVSALRQAVAQSPRTVALYTLVGPDHISLIVIANGATVARTYAISRADLTQKIVSFNRALRDPSRDPKLIAREMYDVLVAPVRADLDQAQAETLVWSLDDVLRYVPIAALFDGKQYLVERYNTVTITPASIAHLADKPDLSNLNAAAMGIAGKFEQALPALPAVRGELYEVVSDAHVKESSGVLPGTILLDGQFTEKAMENQLGSAHAVLHIASHFVFRPGDASQSYLLLAGSDGQGFHLTVADFRDDQRMALDDVDLLTLSACETGISGNAGNGREVDGLGSTAQLKGAKAVISSLWAVNDESTGKLMSDFYKRWVDGGGKLTKVQALRQAQLDLLMHRIKPVAVGGVIGIDYSHPYFWAPFVLMGNWR